MNNNIQNDLLKEIYTDFGEDFCDFAVFCASATYD